MNQNKLQYVHNLLEGQRLIQTFSNDPNNPTICIVGVGRFITRTWYIIKYLIPYYNFELVEPQYRTNIKFKPNLIWSVYPGKIGAYACKLAKKYNAPLVATMRGEFWNVLYDESSNTHIDTCIDYYKAANIITTVSKSIKNRLLTKFNNEFMDHDIRVINNGVDVPNYTNVGACYKTLFNNKFIVGSLTSFPFPEKVRGLLEFILNCYKINENGSVLVGGTPGRILGFPTGKLLNNVHNLGFIQNMHEYYKSIDLYVHSSYRDGQASVVMEALAAHKPVILLDTNKDENDIYNGTNEFIVNGKTGMIVHSINDCIELINEAIKGKFPINNEDLISNINIELNTKYNWGTIANEYKNVFDSLIKEK